LNVDRDAAASRLLAANPTLLDMILAGGYAWNTWPRGTPPNAVTAIVSHQRLD
jgi:hypothetical protein